MRETRVDLQITRLCCEPKHCALWTALYVLIESAYELSSMFGRKQAGVEKFDFLNLSMLANKRRDISLASILNCLSKAFCGICRNYNMHNMGKGIRIRLRIDTPPLYGGKDLEKELLCYLAELQEKRKQCWLCSSLGYLSQ
ncbi:hypothetical protein Tco_0633875 [Tanacetum coccineum]